MLDITLNGAEPTHVERINPQLNVDDTGKISWVPALLDHDASTFYRGKTVTNDEFNTLFLKSVYQGNYLTDVFTKFFDEALDLAIYRSFTTDFNLVPSYVKTISPADWGPLQEDGYYYITIPAEEHGFKIDDSEQATERMNIDTEMYLLEDSGRFYEVAQVDTDIDNTVRIYTDDNTLSGFVVIRTNDKAYALAAATIDATQVQGLAKVATSAKYTDLIDRLTPDGPDTRINNNKKSIDQVLAGELFVGNANFATNAENAQYATNLLRSGTIQNQPISAIFEEASSIVKQATTAKNYTAEGGIATRFTELTEFSTNLFNTTTQLIDELVSGVRVVTNAKNLVSGGTIASDVTATTQELTDSSTKLATTAFVALNLEDKMNKWHVLWDSGGANIVNVSTTGFEEYDLFKIIARIKYDDSNWAALDIGTYTYDQLKSGVLPNYSSAVKIYINSEGYLTTTYTKGVVVGGVLGMKL